MDEEGRLKVRVRAAPADGAANKAVARTVADAIGVPPSSVDLLNGGTSRVKRIAVSVEAGALAARWPGLLTREE